MHIGASRHLARAGKVVFFGGAIRVHLGVDQGGELAGPGAV